MNFNIILNFLFEKWNDIFFVKDFSLFFWFFNRDFNKEFGEERGLDDWFCYMYKEREYIVLDIVFYDYNRKFIVDKVFKVDKCVFWLEYVFIFM